MDLATLAAGSGGTVHDDIKDGTTLYIQHKHDRQMQKGSFVGTKILNRQMAGLARDARQTSAMDMVSGLRAAGLNPALANGAQFGGVSAGGSVPAPSSSPAPAPRGQMGKLTLEALKYEESERDLMAAQSENLRADAAEKRSRIPGNEVTPENIQSNTALNKSNVQFNEAKARNLEAQNRLMDEQARLFADDYEQRVSSDKSIKSMAETYSKMVANDPHASPFDKGIASTLSEIANRGSLAGLDKFIELYGRNSDVLARGIYNKLISDVMSGQMKDKRVMDALKKMPADQRDNLLAQTSQLAATTALANAQTDLTKAEKDKVLEQIKLIKVQAKATYHGDVASMFQAGDWSALGSKLGYDGLVSIVGGVSHGLATGGVLGFFQKFFGSTTTTTSSTTSSTPPIYNGSGGVAVPGTVTTTQLKNLSR